MGQACRKHLFVMQTKFIVALVCSLVAAVVAAPAALAGNNGAVKQKLLANTNGDCSVGAFRGEPIDNSFVILNKAGGRVSATIHLHGAAANGRWQIELDQRPLEGCGNFVVGGIITTNAQGNGNAHVSVPFVPGNTGAFVRLDALNTAAESDGIIASEGTDLS